MPQPIGRTAELGPTPTSVVPSGTVRIAPPPPSPSPSVAPVSGARTTTTTTARTRSITASGTRSFANTPITKGTATSSPPTKGVLPSHSFVFGLTPEETQRSAKGPAALPLRPFGEVRTEDIDLDLNRVLNLFPEIYPDQEPKSEIFYFLPNSYVLEWDALEGYELRTVYSAGTGTAPGQVLMAARLDAGIGPRDVEIAAKIVKSYALAHGLSFKELRALPIDTLSISISDDLGRYNIPSDHVAVHGLSDILGQLDVSWVTDERTKDFIREALVQDVGINGGVIYSATGGALGPRLVPIRMLLGDYSTFGPLPWDRTGLKNPTP